jgi:hypothetical protein
MLLHKHHQSSALVRLLDNPWTSSAAQPAARAAIAAALQSLYQRVRGAASDRRQPSTTSVLDLLPASGLRVSHVAALHLSADDTDVRDDDWFAPLRVAAPEHVPDAFSAVQLVTVVYQTVGVLPSSVPVDPCVLVPAALVGRAGPCMSAAERDADGRLLFDRVLFDRPIGVAVRAGALSAKLANNPLFQSQRANQPPPPPPPRPAAAAVSPEAAVSTTPQPMIRRQASTDSNVRELAFAELVKPVKSPPPPPPLPHKTVQVAEPAPAPISSTIELHEQTPMPSEASVSESNTSSAADAVMIAKAAPDQVAEVEDECEPGAQVSVPASVSNARLRPSSPPLPLSHSHDQLGSSAESLPLQNSWQPSVQDLDLDKAVAESTSAVPPTQPPPPPPPPPPAQPLKSRHQSARPPSMFGAELNAVIQRRASVTIDTQPSNTAAAAAEESSSAPVHLRPSFAVSSGNGNAERGSVAAHASLVASTPLPSSNIPLQSNVHLSPPSSPPPIPPPPPPLRPLNRAVSSSSPSGMPPPPPPPHV